MLTYFLQSSSCLIIFYGIYHFVLAEMTFFRHNRVYLLGAIILSLLLPAIAPYIVMSEEQIPVVHWSYIAAEMENVYVRYDAGYDYETMLWAGLKAVYGIGVLVVLARMIFGLHRIYQYYCTGDKDVKNGFNIITTDAVHLPFSFFKSVYISRHIPLSDHVQTILEHEEIHIKHWHTVDVLFAEAIQAFFWFNPVMILYKRALRQAHEYLADDIICSKNSISSYTELLLSKSQTGMELALTNQFFHSQIKKRIQMMTKNKTNRNAAWKYALVLPLLTCLVVVFSSPEIKSDVQKVFAAITDTIPAVKRVSLDDVQTLSVKNETVRITLKNGEVESYDLSDSKESEIFQEKYSEPLPPPPPMLHGNALMPEGVESIKVEEDRIIVKQTNGISKFFYLSDEEDMKTYKNFYGEIPKPPAHPSPPTVNEQPPSFPPPPSNVNAINKFWGNTKPLFVIDGVIVEGEIENNIDPDDIENITVLKGESATALYPNQGKNGVILIKSKGGKKDKSEIFKIVDQMPRFPGCEDQPIGYERENCAKTKMLEYIYQNLKYPNLARMSGIEGQVVLQFVITKTGTIENIKIVDEIGGGCGEAAKTAIKTMNDMSQKWVSGKQNGQNVDVLYTLPIKFKIEGSTKSKPSESANNKIMSEFQFIVTWKECADQDSFYERLQCSYKKISEFVHSKVNYPEEAIKNKVEGTCQVRAYFDEKGNLINAEIKEHIGYGTGEEALRVVKLLPTMAPAKKAGLPVKGAILIPVTFKMRKNDVKKLSAIKLVVTAYGKEEKIVNSKLPTVIKSTKYPSAISEVDQLPWLDACAHLTDIIEVKKCAENKFLSTLYSNINYPKKAREKGISGTVYAQFVVNKIGNIDDIKILDHIGYGTDESVINALEKLKNSGSWIPGRKSGKVVDVIYQLSVKFEIEGDFKKVVSLSSLDNKLTNVKIFPNPSQDQIHVSFEGDPMDVDIILSDISGKTMVTQNFKNDEFLFKGTIDISHLNIKGNIIVTIKQNNKVIREQIVVIR